MKVWSELKEILQRVVDFFDFDFTEAAASASLPAPSEAADDPVVSRAYKNLIAAPQALRDALVEVAGQVGISPVDLSDVIESESGWDPRQPLEEKGTPRGGLLQLTVGANQPGYETAAAVWGIRSMPGDRQLREVFLPFLRALNLPKGADAFVIYKNIFLPSLANLPDSAAVCSPTLRPQICAANPAFDRNKDGQIQWLEVREVINAIRRRAGGRWITRSGRVIDKPDHVAPSQIPTELATPAPAVLKLREQINKQWPNRPKMSDGILGDLRHQQKKSDHNQGNAIDITRGPGGPETRDLIALFLKDPRTSYVIHETRVYNPSIQGGEGRPYKGDPHARHIHLSIKEGARDDAAPWDLTGVGTLAADVTQGGRASEAILKGLPWAMSQGIVDDILWMPLEFKDLVITVSAEFLSVDGVRIPVSWEEQLELCRRHKCIPETQAVVDRRWALKDRALIITPEQPADQGTQAFVAQVLRVNNRLPPVAPPVLSEGPKHWLLDGATRDRPVNYGLFREDGTVWQTKGHAHNAKHKDYSQMLALVSQKATFQGKEISLIERARKSGKYDAALLDFLEGK